MAVEVDRPCLELVETICIRHLNPEPLLQGYVLDLTHEELTQVCLIDDLIVLEGIEAQVSDQIFKIVRLGCVSLFEDDLARYHLDYLLINIDLSLTVRRVSIGSLS